MNYRVMLPLLCVCLLLFVPAASAHAPLSAGDNRNLASATVISDPLKSWVIYGHLHEPGEAAYFQMTMATGDRLVLALNVNRADSPVPDLIVMGPGIASSGSVPPSVEVPPGSGTLVIPGTRPEKAAYEAFAPSVLYEVASHTMIIDQPGTYYAAVYNTGHELDYSFVEGYQERFTMAEWLVTPLSLISIYLWEGQSPWFVAAPYILVILLGSGLLAWYQKKTRTTRSIQAWIASGAGLLYIGTGASTLNQMVWVVSFTGFTPECVITVIFAVIPVLLGIWALSIGWPQKPLTTARRISLAAIGMLGFVAWAGLILGPVLALVAAVLPEKIDWGGGTS